MRKTSLLFVLLAATTLAGCMETDGERALAGAGAGAIVADAFGKNAVAGAAIGGLAGAFCDDAGVCR